MIYIWRRLVRISFTSAIIIALPAIFLCVWYSTSAMLSLRKYESAVKEDSQATMEFFHIHLYDMLQRDLNWILSPGEPEKSKIETFVVEVSHNNMIELHGGAGKTSNRPYVPAKMGVDGRRKSIDIEVRLRGSRHWHYLSRKKSMKIKVVDNDVYKGHQVFNLINQATPLVVGQKIIADVAGENGVMVPSYEFARVILNGEDLGVFHFQAQPDDTLFRKNRTMYSDFFSGNVIGDASPLALWEEIKHWKKVTSQLHSNKENVKRLKEFLYNISNASHEQFSKYAAHHIDMEAFARFEAIDVVFGVEQHGFKENQKLYFDPYKGSWVPVAWDLRGFKHDGVINRVENPITLRLKMIPEYRALRNAAVWELLQGDAGVNQIRKRTAKQLAVLVPELANDRLFSAYKQLPKVNEFAFKMLRPMSMNKLSLVLASEMMSFERRHTFLTNQFQKSEFYYRMGKAIQVGPIQLPKVAEATDVVTGDADNSNPIDKDLPTAVIAIETDTETELSDNDEQQLPDNEAVEVAQVTPMHYETQLDIIVAGQVGIALEKLNIDFNECEAPKWKLLYDGQDATLESTGNLALFKDAPLLYAASMFAKREKGDTDLNQLQLEPIPTPYSYVLLSNCEPKSVEIFGTHQITQNRVRAQRGTSEIISQIPKRFPARSAVPFFKIGVLSPHPKHKFESELEVVTLGPGIVEVPQTRIYDEYTEVYVNAGTLFKMGEDASLIFKGKVNFDGLATKPIRFERLGKTAWGGIAIQGPATAGSRMSHIMMEKGSFIKGQPVVYTSMLNLYDTKDIRIEGCSIKENTGLGDAFHAAYVKDLELRDIRIEDVTMDAIDIEFSEASIYSIWIRGVGDDGLDLMDSKVKLSDSVIMQCAQHGVSAGENSYLQATDFLVAGSSNGVFGKDSSKIDIGTGLLLNNQTGVRVGKPTGLYGGDVEIAANSLYVMGSKQLVQRTDRRKDKLDDGKILFGFVDERPLRHLFNDLLHIESSKQLDAWMAAQQVKK